MEIFIFIGLACLITFFMPWINAMRISSFRYDYQELENRLRELERKYKLLLERQVSAPPSPQPEQQDIQEDIEQDIEPVQTSKPVAEPSPAFKDPFAAAREKRAAMTSSIIPKVTKTEVPQTRYEQNEEKIRTGGFEMQLAAKLPVWIGAASLIFGAIFLIKYSIDAGWLTPVVRVWLGALFGGGLLFTGQKFAEKDHLANAKRIAQGLFGAGLVALYASIYAAVSLYTLIPPLIGFGGMVAVSALSVILALRHGEAIAVFGLIGGFLTPILVGAEEPNTIALFGYLFVFFVFMFGVMVKRGWWLLSLLALVGVFGWSSLWLLFFFVEAEAFIVLLFVMGVATVVLGATGRQINTTEEQRDVLLWPLHALNFMTIIGTVATIFWVGMKLTLTLFDWSLLGLLSMATMALAFFKPHVYEKPLFLKGGVTLFLLALWVVDVSFGEALLVISSIGALYLIGSEIIMRHASDPRHWAAFQVAATFGLYLISYFFLDFPADMAIAEDKIWGYTALLIAACATLKTGNAHHSYEFGSTLYRYMSTLYALSASAFISMGFVILLPWGYAAMAIAGQLAATAWVYQQLRIPVLRTILWLLTIGFALMNLEQIILYADVIISSLVDETPRKSFLSRHILDLPFLQLGLPILCLGYAAVILPRQNIRDKSLVTLIFTITTALTLAMTHYGIRLFFLQDGVLFADQAGFMERGIITITFAALGVTSITLLQRYQLSDLSAIPAKVLHLCALRFMYFDLFLHNPYLDRGQFVGDLPLLNGITMTYGACIALSYWMLRRYQQEEPISNFFRKLYKLVAGLAMFALISLHVRYAYQGDMLYMGNMSAEEFYTYSVVWLLCALASLSVGIMRDIKSLRMAATAMMAGVIFKVFLLDAAELEGLYRIFSFIGLGVSLIGLSYFYTRFMIRLDQQKDA